MQAGVSSVDVPVDAIDDALVRRYIAVGQKGFNLGTCRRHPGFGDKVLNHLENFFLSWGQFAHFSSSCMYSQYMGLYTVDGSLQAPSTPSWRWCGGRGIQGRGGNREGGPQRVHLGARRDPDGGHRPREAAAGRRTPRAVRGVPVSPRADPDRTAHERRHGDVRPAPGGRRSALA